MPALLSFLLTALLVELTPGPNMAYLAIVSTAEGRKAGYAATLGIAVGLALVGCAAALGLAALLAASPLAFQLLRWAGALYLLWLAWEAWSAGGEVSPGQTAATQPPFRHFRRGLIVNLLNPKAALFFVAILPGFIDPAFPAAWQTLVLSVTYVAIATAIHLTIVTLSAALRPWLTDADRQRTTRRIFALLLAGVAIWFLLTTA